MSLILRNIIDEELIEVFRDLRLIKLEALKAQLLQVDQLIKLLPTESKEELESNIIGRIKVVEGRLQNDRDIYSDEFDLFSELLLARSQK